MLTLKKFDWENKLTSKTSKPINIIDVAISNNVIIIGIFPSKILRGNLMIDYNQKDMEAIEVVRK